MMPFEPLDPDQEKPFAEYCAEVLRQVPIARAECEREANRVPGDAEPDQWFLRTGFYYGMDPYFCAAQAFVEEDSERGGLLSAWDKRVVDEFCRSLTRKPSSFPEETAERCPFCGGAMTAHRMAVTRTLDLDCRNEECVGYSRDEGVNPWTGARRTESADFKPGNLHIIRRDSRVEVRRGECVVTFDAAEESFVEVFRIAASISTTPS